MNDTYLKAVSDYNLKELKRSLAAWRDESLAQILAIDVCQVRLLKRIINKANEREE